MVNLSFRQKQTAVCLFMHYLDKDIVKSPDSIGKIMSALRFIFRCNLQSLAIFDDESFRSVRTSLRARGRLGCAKNTLVGSTMNVTVDMLNWIRELKYVSFSAQYKESYDKYILWFEFPFWLSTW
jgi:hypothetical protein